MTLQIPKGEYVPDADQRVVMNGVSWEHYEALLEIRGERSRPRMAYLDGALELMTKSEDHERINWYIRSMVEAYLQEVGIEYGGYGEWTMRKQKSAAGIEADQCYRLGADQQRGRWPDLAIEVSWTSGGIDKLEAYRRIGVREVWFWKDDELQVYFLVGTKYEQRAKSELVPGIDLDLVCELVDRPTVSQAVREFRASLRS